MKRLKRVGEWRSQVAHLFWVQGVGGSNPLSPTISIKFHYNEPLAELAFSGNSRRLGPIGVFLNF